MATTTINKQAEAQGPGQVQPKSNTSLLEIRDFRDRLESLNQRALVGAVTGNRWWVSLKYRIRDLATKYGRQLNLDKTKEAKSIEDRLSRAVAGGTP